MSALVIREPLVVENSGHFELRDDRHACRFPIPHAFLSDTPDRTGVRFHVIAREFGGGLEDGSFELWYVDRKAGVERHLGKVRDALEPAADAPLNPWIVVRPATFKNGSPLERVKTGLRSAGIVINPQTVGQFIGDAIAGALTRRAVRGEIAKGSRHTEECSGWIAGKKCDCGAG